MVLGRVAPDVRVFVDVFCSVLTTVDLVVVGVAMILIYAYLLTIGSNIVSIGVSYSQAD